MLGRFPAMVSSEAAYTEGDQGDLDGTAKRKKNEEKISWRPQPAAPEVKARSPARPIFIFIPDEQTPPQWLMRVFSGRNVLTENPLVF